MRIGYATAKAVKHSVLSWHYSKSVPMVQVAYSVFNDLDEFCGVICYSIGANNNIAKPFGLAQGEVIELVRVALNGKQGRFGTGKALSITLKMLKKDVPSVKLVVSYADSSVNHLGVLYQATNWVYLGASLSNAILVDGRLVHKKTVFSKYNTNSINELKAKGVDVSKSATIAKHKYVYPFDKKTKKAILQIALPFPKS